MELILEILVQEKVTDEYNMGRYKELKKIHIENEKPYIQWIKNELNQYDIKVQKWGEFNDTSMYYAYFNTNRVYIPIPQCDYSFLVSLHEIGHIVTGNNILGHIAEFSAEKWAVSTAKKKYKITNDEFISVGKEYIYECLLEDIIYRLFDYNQIDKNIQKWIGKNKKDIKQDAIIYYNEFKPFLSNFHQLKVNKLLKIN